MAGRPVTVWAAVIPGAYHVEQWLHRKMKGSNIVWYKGDGHREWFWFWVAPFVWVFMVLVTVAEGAALAWAVGKLTETDGLEWYVCFLKVLWGWAVLAVEFLILIFEKLF